MRAQRGGINLRNTDQQLSTPFNTLGYSPCGELFLDKQWNGWWSGSSLRSMIHNDRMADGEPTTMRNMPVP